MEIRTATINDLEAIAAAEAKCFTQAEATPKKPLQNASNITAIISG